MRGSLENAGAGPRRGACFGSGDFASSVFSRSRGLEPFCGPASSDRPREGSAGWCGVSLRSESAWASPAFAVSPGPRSRPALERPRRPPRRPLRRGLRSSPPPSSGD